MRTRILAAGLVLILGSLEARAEDLTVVPSVGYGFSNFAFTNVQSGIDEKAQFDIVDFAMTAARGRVYLRLNSEIPLGEEYSIVNGVRKYKRQDYSFALGYYLADSLSLYGGYSYGKTSVLIIGTGSLVTFTDSGPFVGAIYSFPVGDLANIAISGAYAAMDGSRASSSSAGTDIGNTNGFSLGITWSDTYRGNANYYVSYKHKSYLSQLVNSDTFASSSYEKRFNIFSLGFVFPI